MFENDLLKNLFGINADFFTGGLYDIEFEEPLGRNWRLSFENDKVVLYLATDLGYIEENSLNVNNTLRNAILENGYKFLNN